MGGVPFLKEPSVDIVVGVVVLALWIVGGLWGWILGIVGHECGLCKSFQTEAMGCLMYPGRGAVSRSSRVMQLTMTTTKVRG